MITLCADPTSDLDWEETPNEGGIFHLDFGWNKLDPHNVAQFNANLFAIEQFAKQFPHAKKVVLAISDGNFDSLLSFSKPIEAPEDFELFCAQIFSEYLHRLASALPEETIPAIVFSIPKEADFAKLVLLLCRRRFEHFELQFSGQNIPIIGDAKVAVSLPQDALYDPKIFQEIFNSLQGRAFKCIPEELLNEHWDGVDELIVHAPTLGETGKRMICGFEAAGGVVVYKNGAK